MDVRTLLTDGFVCINYPPTIRTAIDDAMHAWQRYCRQPFEQKCLLSDPDPDASDFGYMFRTGTKDKSDRKEVFHYNRRDRPEFERRIPLFNTTCATDFTACADKVIELIAPVVMDCTYQIELAYNLPGYMLDTLNHQRGWTIRFLHYLGNEPGNENDGGTLLAHPHADRGGITFHLKETEGGGQYLDKAGIWHDWPVNENQAIFFPGMKLQYRSQCALKALWHSVAGNPGRFAMVGFVDFASTYRFNLERRQQEFPEGFNYTISMDEFSKLFVPYPTAQ